MNDELPDPLQLQHSDRLRIQGLSRYYQHLHRNLAQDSGQDKCAGSDVASQIKSLRFTVVDFMPNNSLTLPENADYKLVHRNLLHKKYM
jgi:hypothetical protein